MDSVECRKSFDHNSSLAYVMRTGKKKKEKKKRKKRKTQLSPHIINALYSSLDLKKQSYLPHHTHLPPPSSLHLLFSPSLHHCRWGFDFLSKTLVSHHPWHFPPLVPHFSVLLISLSLPPSPPPYLLFPLSFFLLSFPSSSSSFPL